jgi:hypothetical protein
MCDSAKASDGSASKAERAGTRAREPQNWTEFRFIQDGGLKVGSLRAEGHLDQAELFFKAAAAFGKTVNHGWELSGPVSGRLAWQWERGLFGNGHWDGSLTFAKSELQAASVMDTAARSPRA